MQQQVLILTKDQQLIQARLGRPLDEFIREEYVTKARDLAEVSGDLGIGISTLSRWMTQLGIPARRKGARS